MAVKVTLRKKLISGNQESLYLDMYRGISNPKTGKTTRREFLNLFLISETESELQHYIDKNGKPQRRIMPVLNKAGQPKIRRLSAWDKQHNKDTWELAEKIRNRRVNEINKPLIYSDLEKERLKAMQCERGNFVEYFKELADKKHIKEKENWNVVYKNLRDYTAGSLQFHDLNESFCEDFKNYLLGLKAYKSEKIISQNSACTYFVKFKAGVKKAFKDKKIPSNVAANVSTIKLIESERNFLTLDELNKLVKANCEDPVLKKAIVFSSLTGLRKSDILKLTWREIEVIDNKPVVRLRIQKTKGIETLWISDQAYRILGDPGKPDDKVFKGLKINSYNSRFLLLWLKEAGISKKISFHNFRHTYATLQLSQGTDIYTVSRLLGHKNVRTTQIYAKVVDKLKQDAANRIKLDMAILPLLNDNTTKI